MGLRFTLLGDGASDRLLLHPIRWALRSMHVAVETGRWADLSRARPKPRSLRERVRLALDLYPAEMLFLHRDAEGIAWEARAAEARAAADHAGHFVAVIPVRMTEAWLLHDEAAIRRASGNPNGTVPLSLPLPARVEGDPDPKATLLAALLDASELQGRRRQKKRATFGEMRARTAELIADFGPLRAAPAFDRFLCDLEASLIALGQLEPRG